MHLRCRSLPDLPSSRPPLRAKSDLLCLGLYGARLCSLFPTSLCGVLVFLAATPLARPSLPPLSFSPPSVLLLHTHLTSLPNTQSSHHLTHTHTHLVISHLTFTHTQTNISHLTFTHTTQLSHQLTHTHTQLVISSSDTHTHTSSHLTYPLTTSSIRPSCHTSHPQWPAQSPETAEGAAARVVAAGGPALSAVAGAVSTNCRRGCGARCRRWGPGSLRSGQRSLQRLQKGLRRALSPLGAPANRIVSAAGSQLHLFALLVTPHIRSGRRVVAAEGPALSAVAGAVSRDCRRGCGARCRRWGPGSLRSGRRSLQRLQKGLLGARLSPQWPAQSPETAEGARRWGPGSLRSGRRRRGCGARCRRWGLGSLRSGRRSLQRLQKGLRRALSPLGAPASRIVSAAGRMFEKPVSAPLPLCFAKQWFSLYGKRSVNAAARAFVKPVSALLPL